MVEQDEVAVAERVRLALECGQMAIWDLDPETGACVWSGEVEAIFGGAARDLTYFDRLAPLVHEDDRKTWRKAVDEVLAGSGALNVELRVRWPDGSVHWVLARSRVIGPPGERPLRIVGFMMNTTERKRVEMQMKTERQDLADLFEGAPAFIAVTHGPDHIYSMMNRAHRELTGRNDLIGKTAIGARPEMDDQGFHALLDWVYQTGHRYAAYGARLSIVRTQGEPPEERYLDFVYQPRHDPDGAVCGIIALGIDVTEQRRAQAALIESDKLAAVGRLASSIAHEINNPLAAVTNYLYLAKESEDRDEVREYLAIIEREVLRVSTISRQTLLSQKQSTSMSAITFDDLTESVLSLYGTRVKKLGVTVETRHTTDRPMVCLEGDIRQVLGNLIANALDAMDPDGGRLLLRGREATDWASGKKVHRLTVADTGTGVDRRTMRRIFDAFFTTKGFSGNGLGLWISQEIVARHRGRLRVRSSTRPGRRGTVFVLSLPRVP